MFKTKYSKFDYLNILESNNPWGLFVTGAGWADVPPNSCYPPTKHPEKYMFDWKHGRTLPNFSIVYITNGEGVFETKEIRKRIVKEGTIFFLFPNVWHRYCPNKKNGWKEYWVSFNGEIPKKLLNNNILQQNRPIFDIGLNETIISLFNQILLLLENETVGFREIIASLTYQIIAQINSANRIKQFGGKRIEQVILKAKIYFSENLSDSIDFKELSKNLNVGYSWFRRMFKHYTHFSPSQYFQSLKLNKAKSLLVETTLNIYEISNLLGFKSQFYFSKFFKKHTNLTPSKWRNNYRSFLK